MRRAFAGLWEQELNLADPEIVTRLADEAGLPGGKIVAHAVSDEISAAYEQNRQEAIVSGVFGSPCWVLDGEVFWGQDRIELLADALKSGRKAYTSDV
jgi:2-hydroxychromene-2-carboxylate isomerase